MSFVGVAANAEFDEQLKHLFLWFDEVIFEDIGKYDRKAFLERRIDFEGLKYLDRNLLTETFVPAREAVKLDWDGRFREGLFRGYPRWGAKKENYSYPDPQSPEEIAHNELLRKIEQEYGVSSFDDGYQIEQVEGRARVAVDAVSLWREINKLLPCVMNATPDEEAALSSFQKFHQRENAIFPTEIISGSLPNLSLLSWSELLEIKRNSSLAALKRKVKEIIEKSKVDVSSAKKDFASAERELCEEIIDRSRPKPGKALFEGLLGNTPMGIPNPFSIAFSWRTFSHEVAAEEKYGWVYLLRDIRSAIERAERAGQ